MYRKQKKLSQFLLLNVNISSSGHVSAVNSIGPPLGLKGSLQSEWLRSSVIFFKKRKLAKITIPCHSFSLVVTRCLALSLVVSRCHLLYNLLSFVVTPCHPLSLVVPLVVPLVVTRCTISLPFYKRSSQRDFQLVKRVKFALIKKSFMKKNVEQS